MLVSVRSSVAWSPDGCRGRQLLWRDVRVGGGRMCDRRRRCSGPLVLALGPAAVSIAAIAKEELRQRLAAARDRADDAEIRTRLYRFYSWCADTKIPELTRLATTIETWWPAILAFLHTGLTNARTEGTTGWSNRSNASPAASATPRTHAAGYASTAPAPSGPASDSPPRTCPANFEEPVTMASRPSVGSRRYELSACSWRRVRNLTRCAGTWRSLSRRGIAGLPSTVIRSTGA